MAISGILFLFMAIGFAIIFIAFIAVVVVVIIKVLNDRGGGRYSALTVDAKITSMRENVSYDVSSGGSTNTDSKSIYHATFETENGERLELRIGKRDYGRLVEGDIGRLTYQGTKYKGFERVRQ